MSRPIIAWSFSALGEFVNCPYKYWAVKVGKIVSDVNVYNKAGDDYHQQFEQYLTRGTKLEDSLQRFAPMLDKFRRAPGQLLVEQQFCLDQNYQPCGYKDWNNAWVRGAADVMVLNGTVASVVDWKFGKVKKDPEQLSLLSALVFHHYPQVQQVRGAYVYANHDKVVPFDFARSQLTDIWNHFLPDVNKLVVAKTKDEWPKTPNPLCGWCPVKTCQYNTNTQSDEPV